MKSHCGPIAPRIPIIPRHCCLRGYPGIIICREISGRQRAYTKTQACKGEESAGKQYGCYQTLGDLLFDFRTNNAGYPAYRKELDLTDGTISVSYDQEDKHFTRKVFTSYPDRVLAAHFSCDVRGAVNFIAEFSRAERYKVDTQPDQLVVSGAMDNGQGSDGVK